jgi:hypothetical protein
MILPFHIWYIIFKHVDIKTLSAMSIVNKVFNEYITYHKWSIIDKMKVPGYPVPANEQTYLNYKYSVDWNSIILYGIHIPDSVIENILTFDYIQLLFSYRRLSDYIVRKFFHTVNWRNLLFNQTLSDDLLQRLVDNNNLYSSDWKMLWRYQSNITPRFVSKYYNYVDWECLSVNKNLSLNVIEKYKNQLIWSEMTKTGLHEYILLKYIEKLDALSWVNVSWYSKLSPFFIKTFIKFLDKHVILHSQKVPEDILEYILESCNDSDLSEYLNVVAKYQPLSSSFIKKYKSFLNFNVLISNKYISKVDLQKIYG